MVCVHHNRAAIHYVQGAVPCRAVPAGDGGGGAPQTLGYTYRYRVGGVSRSSQSAPHTHGPVSRRSNVRWFEIIHDGYNSFAQVLAFEAIVSARRAFILHNRTSAQRRVGLGHCTFAVTRIPRDQVHLLSRCPKRRVSCVDGVVVGGGDLRKSLAIGALDWL